MTGAQKATPNNSLGMGIANVPFDGVATTAGGTGGVVLDFGITNTSPSTGSFSQTYTLTSASFSSLLSSTTAGLAYVNLHSTVDGGGEIRAFLMAPVPEPETYAMRLVGLGLLGAIARRNKVKCA